MLKVAFDVVLLCLGEVILSLYEGCRQALSALTIITKTMHVVGVRDMGNIPDGA